MARLPAQMGASRCRKSAILLSGIMSAAVRDQRISRNPCDGFAAAGLTGLTPHDLRHTAASLAIASASVKHVQRMLGHKDAAMTLNVYASLFEDDLDDVSNRLDAALLEAAAACVRPEPSAETIDCLSELPGQLPD